MEKERRALTLTSRGLRPLELPGFRPRFAPVATFASVALVSLSGATALAANDEAARSIAQPLFDDGVKLMEEAHCDDQTIPPDRRPQCREALAKFKKAFDIYPAGLGALRNAAFCERGLGMFASATRDFREVARRAPLDPNPSKQLWAKHAADEADVLGKLVPHVTVTLERSPRDAHVRLDGAEIPAAALGVSIPVDPGDHVLEAEAPGHERFRKPFEIEAKEDLPIVVRLKPVPIIPPTPVPPEKRSYALPATLIGVGVLGVGVGLGLGFAAKHARDDACDGSPLHCHDSAGLDRARGYALGSTIATAAGAALVVGGVVVILATGPKHREIALITSPGGASIAGVF